MIWQILIVNMFVLLTNAAKAGKDEITTKSGTIQSQNKEDGLSTYGDNAREIHRFNVKGVHKYTFTFKNVDIEKGYDFIRIYNADHDEVEKITGVHSKKVVVVNSKKATIEFSSDDSTGGGGWVLNYKAGGAGVSSKEVMAIESELRRLTKQVSSLSLDKGRQVFFDLGLVDDAPATKNLRTLQLNRHYHVTTLFVELDQEFACKHPGFYEFSVWGQVGRTGNTMLQIQQFSMHRPSAAQNGLWFNYATGFQPRAFGNIETTCIINMQMNDRIRLRYNGTFTDDHISRKFHFTGGLFA